MTKPVFVYIISCGDHVKIGVSNNPTKRLETMATGMPVRPVLYHAREFSSRADAMEIERQLPAKFRRNKSHREWFAVPAKIAKNMLSAAKLRSQDPRPAGRIVADIFEKLYAEPDLLL